MKNSLKDQLEVFKQKFKESSDKEAYHIRTLRLNHEEGNNCVNGLNLYNNHRSAYMTHDRFFMTNMRSYYQNAINAYQEKYDQILANDPESLELVWLRNEILHNKVTLENNIRNILNYYNIPDQCDSPVIVTASNASYCVFGVNRCSNASAKHTELLIAESIHKSELKKNIANIEKSIAEEARLEEAKAAEAIAENATAEEARAEEPKKGSLVDDFANPSNEMMDYTGGED